MQTIPERKYCLLGLTALPLVQGIGGVLVIYEQNSVILQSIPAMSSQLCGPKIVIKSCQLFADSYPSCIIQIIIQVLMEDIMQIIMPIIM